MNNYNATDIERYLSSKMTVAEMHAFEEAMMNDPFLADAVDGYRSVGTDVDFQKDVSELKEKIAKKQTGAKVIKGSFRQWMSIAAGLIVLLSTSVVLYRIFNTDKQTALPQIAADVTKADTVKNKPQTMVDSQTAAVVTKPPAVDRITVITPGKKEPVIKDVTTVTQPANNSGTVADIAIAKDDTESKITTVTPAPVTKPSAQINAETETVARKESSQKSNYNYSRLNKFSGQVVDENNQPLPFANITERNSRIGTYTDANGYFTIVSSDTVVNVETRSVGYSSANAVMRNNQSQRIILKDEAVIANAPTKDQLYEKNKQRASANKSEVEEIYNTEPADGWSKYNTYVLNNMREPDIKDKKQTTRSEVEVSFDVNPDGSIANIKIEKSNCKNCNKEAIRIIQEGPKWKSKTGKTERTRFTVQF
jgi:CarboxypepD_reg-like domain/Gram-negative bacterial TonB protein C-terminal